MTWTPTDEQVEKAAEEMAWRYGTSGNRAVLPIDRNAARAVLVAVGPTIAAQALRDAGMAVETIDPAWDSALWTEGKYVPVPEWLNNRADTIEKEAGR